MTALNAATIHEIAAELLLDHPEGFDVAELNALVLAAAPEFPKPTIRHHVWKLDARLPEVFYSVAPGRIALHALAA
jgi:hypothetical protein